MRDYVQCDIVDVMGTGIPAPVNPMVLAWARTESGYDVETAATKLRLAPERLAAWEKKGGEQPTLRQAERLAALYHRPLPVLFLPLPPKVVPLAAEFRRLPGVHPGEESPELRLALRTLRRRREIALDLFEENEETPVRFKLSAHLRDSPEHVGQRIREALGVSFEEQRGWTDQYKAWRAWRDGAEALGLLVFQVPGVPLRQMRGIALFRDPLPVIAVSSRDHPLARAFTLIHELSHLMLRTSGDERPAAEEIRRAAEWAELERFADSAAAAALMPRESVLNEREVRDKKRDSEWNDADISSLARRYRVSPVAFLTRLAMLDRVTWAFYHKWRVDWEKRWENRPKPKTTGGPSRVDTILSRVGPTYAALVIDSLERDLITPLVASDALDLKVHHFEKLKRALLFGTEAPPVLEGSAW